MNELEINKPFHAIDINLNKVESTKIAYYRLDDGLFQFIEKCMEENKVIGFAWEGDRNFGIILADKFSPLKTSLIGKFAGIVKDTSPLKMKSNKPKKVEAKKKK